MSDEQINVINERVALEDVKNQMARYQKVAEAYANATPEQRAQVDPALVQSVIDKYNELKERRNGLLAQQETRIQQEMQQQRAAQEAAARKAAQWRGRTVKKTKTNNNAFPVATNKDWTIRWSDGSNRYEDGRIRDYWMSVNPNAGRQKTAWNNAYDSRYDVNSPDYVYNKWSYNWKWQYVVNPEFADTYGKYDASGRRVSDDVLAERQAYKDALDMPWEKITWMTTEDLIEAGTILYPAVKATQFAKFWTIWKVANAANRGRYSVPSNVYKNSVLNSDYNSVMSNPSYEALRTNPSTLDIRLSNPALLQQGVNTAVNNTYRWVLSNPTYNGLRTIPSTLRWTNQVTQPQFVNSALNNGWRWALSNPTFNGLRTIPNTLRWGNQLEQQAINSALNNGWRWAQTTASYVSPQLRTFTPAAVTPVSTPNVVNSWGELSRVRWY